MVHPIGKALICPLVRLWRGKVTGVENIPNPPFIIAANHASYLDDLLLPAYFVPRMNKRLHIFVNSRFYKNKMLRAFLYNFDCIPVDVAKDNLDEKKRKKTNEAAFRKAVAALRNGDNFMVFPEGSRSSDGKLKEAKTGVARVALQTGVPVLPVGIVGSYEILPKGASFPKFKRAHFHIGKPLYFKTQKMGYASQVRVTRKIMKSIAKLARKNYAW